MKAQSEPKHGIRKLLWLAKTAFLIFIKLKKIKIAKPVHNTPKIVAEIKLAIEILDITKSQSRSEM